MKDLLEKIILVLLGFVCFISGLKAGAECYENEITRGGILYINGVIYECKIGKIDEENNTENCTHFVQNERNSGFSEKRVK